MADGTPSTETKTDTTKKTKATTAKSSLTPVDVAAGGVAKDTTTETNVFYSSVKVFFAGILVYPVSVVIQATFSESPRATVTLPADARLYNLGRFDRVPVQIFVMETMAEADQYILMFEGFITGNSYMNTYGQRQLTYTCVAYTEVFEDAKLKFLSSIEECFFHDVVRTDQLMQTVFKPDIQFPQCLFFEGMGYKLPNNEGFGDPYSNVIKMPTQYLANIMAFMEEAGTKHAPAAGWNDSIVSKYYATLSYNLHLDRRFCWLPYFDKAVDESKLPTNKDKDKGTDTAKAKDKDNNKKGTDTDTETSTKYRFSWESEQNITEEDIRSGKKNAMFPVLYGMQNAIAVELLSNTLTSSSREFSIHDLIYYLVDRIEYEFLVIPNPAYQGKSNIKREDKGAEIDKRHSVVLADADLKDSQGIDGKTPIDPATIQELSSIMEERYSPNRDCPRMVNFCLKPLMDDSFPPLCNVIFRSQVTSISTSNTFNRYPTRIQVTNFIPSRANAKTEGVNSEALLLYGATDFYPSEYYDDEKMDYTLEEGKRAAMSCELREQERRTGPWVIRDRAPEWLFYAVREKANSFIYNNESGQQTVNIENRTQIRKVREQYMRRQLTRAQILKKQLTARCVFLPYVTCGFPAVVFDAANTGFAFTGNVMAYEHTFSATEMSTTVILNGVRLLTEAQVDEEKGNYPSPINSVHVITHKKDRVSLVYNSILGTPSANTISGANAATWDEIIENWYGPVDDVEASPQTNIYKAYKIQRRNVINLPDYATFMNMTYNGTDLDSEWLRDRTPIKVYNEVPLAQAILPVPELQKLKQDKQQLEDAKKAAEKEKEEINAEHEKIKARYTQRAADRIAREAALDAAYDAKLTECYKLAGLEPPSPGMLAAHRGDYSQGVSEAEEQVAFDNMCQKLSEEQLRDYNNFTASNTEELQQIAKEAVADKAKIEEAIAEYKSRTEAANKTIAEAQAGIDKMNKKIKEKSGTSNDKKFENLEEKNVRDILTEVRNETAKHYIY